MKKLALGLSVLFSSLVTTSFANHHVNLVKAPCYNGGFIFGLAGFYAQPNSENLGYAVTFLTTDESNKTFHKVNPRYDVGYKIDLGYIFPGTANDIRASYSYLSSTKKNSLQNLPINTQIVGTVIPTSFTVTDLEKASAEGRAKFKYQVYDLDFGQHVDFGYRTHVRFLTGLRFADLKTQLSTTAKGEDVFGINNEFKDEITNYSNQSSKVHGLGPRLGSNVHYKLARNLAVFGEVDTSLLVSKNKTDFDTHSVELNTVSGAVSLTKANYNYANEWRVVPNASYKIGMDYAYEFSSASHSKLIFEAGYMADYYFNTGDRISIISGSTLPQATHLTNLSVAGPYVNLEFQI